MKLTTSLLIAVTLICGSSLAYAGDPDNGTGVTPRYDRLQERSTTGMGTRDSIPPRRDTYSDTRPTFLPRPEPGASYLRADRDDFPISGYRR